MNRKIVYFLGFGIILLLLFFSNVFFQSGFFLSNDISFTPKICFDLLNGYNFFGIYNQLPIYYFLKFLNFFIDGSIIEKFLLILPFVLSYISGYLIGYKIIKTDNVFIWILLGIFLAFNPFTYSRFLFGQRDFLIGFSFFVIYFVFLYEFFIERKKEKFFFIILFSILSAWFKLHFLYINFLIFIIFLIIFFNKQNFKYFLGFIIFNILLNLYWLIPIVFDKTYIDPNSFYNFSIFKNYTNGLGNYFNTLFLYNFWGIGVRKFFDFTLINKNWFVSFIIIILVSFLGLIQIFKKRKKFFYVLLIVFIVGYILSLGYYDNIFSGINKFLYYNLPFFDGFREVQKFDIFLLVVYVVGFGFGLNVLFKKLKQYEKILFITFLMLILLITNFTFLFNLRGQLFFVNYPKEWYDIKNCFSKENIGDKKIVFPWHSYIGLKFAKRIVLNPAGCFFGNSLVADNIEIGKIYSQSIRPESKIIEKYIAPWGLFRNDITDNEIKQFIQDLKGLGIEYIILLKEVDWKFYEKFLEKAKDLLYLDIVKDNDMIRLYRIK